MNQLVYFGKEERIGEMLVNNGKIEQNQLDRALSHQATVHSRIGEILITLGFVGEDDLMEILAEQLSIEIYTPKKGDEFIPLVISKPFLRQHPMAAIKRDGQQILLISNPLDGEVIAAAEVLISNPFDIQIVSESEIKKIAQEHYGLTFQDLNESDLLIDESDIDKLKDMASEAPVIKYVNAIIDTAVTRRASDIHIEPFDDGLLIRFRVDGILQDYEMPPPSMQAAIISRTKLLAALDIAERRLPQDGKISMRISGKEIDLRVSTMPTIYGEGVVIRILEKGSVVLDLNRLGMSPETEARFRKLITMPDGIILVTGPTGSGKTTTLYCALNHINSGSNKIITIEDPVEYQLHGINQIQVRPEINLTFAKGLRSIVRQDPDIIMVGEIRDLETAEIAVQSSLTGHLVFSTLHTNDAISAVIRMADIGVERFLLVSSLRGIMAQRLVRQICPYCKERKGLVSEALGTPPFGEDFYHYEGKGCEHCSSNGYSGRIALFEFLVIDDELARGISQGLDLVSLKAIAEKQGFKPLFKDGIDKVKAGITTLAEVIRVSGGSDIESL
ncbi:MAG: Flp pilus assembly complex ATPase component TadA [Proteobacteria bacterium]|nr:Flp pilus assembly complex ATPase component TadA [Pseudomonadota bacterium]MBU1716613.1 Flp pilus assembly complex ATPase component TadA [Pseudomonadota bacterium]